MTNLLVFTFDEPSLFDCANTPIPRSSDPSLTVIHAAPESAVYVLHITDVIGQFIGLYGGKSGFEVLKCVIAGGGVYTKAIKVYKNERLSLRSLEDLNIATGKLFIEFFQRTRM